MSNTVKSVHITNYYHKDSGGISTSYNNLMAAAERHERHIRLIVPGANESYEDINPFARIYYVPAKTSPIIDKRYRVIMPWQYLAHGSVIRRILLDERPNFIEVTDKYTLSMLGAMIRTGNFRKLGRPMLVHFSCERMDDNIRSYIVGGKCSRCFSRAIIRNYHLPLFDFHVSNSGYTADEFHSSVTKPDGRTRAGWLLNKTWRWFKAPRIVQAERLFVCPRGVDVQHYSPDHRSEKVRREMINAAGVPETATLLLYAGRLSPEKNIALLVDMMTALAKDADRDYRLLVAGDGPMANWLQRRSDRYLDGKIVQLGHLENDALAKYYANADAFVHPNPHEPFGIAPLEAMASGVPTIAPNSGGILSYATNDNAWLVAPTGKAFAAAVREIVSNAQLRDRKTTLAVETARKNTWEASTDHLFATYDRMYSDFQKRNELYTDRAATRNFDYADLVKLTLIACCCTLTDLCI
jgi:glycosyltransferase involved in cell wall biosynthesis